jgi:hypothetical protein
MINLNVTPRLLVLKAVSVALFATASIGAWAQDSFSTTIRHGESSFDTEVRNARVVYVEGNDLVLKLEDGKVEHLIVPDTDKFTIDGKDVTVRELAPGTKLTQTITTTTAPRFVTSVRTIKGKVWHVNAPRTVIVTLPDGTNHTFKVPDHAKFIVNGKPKSVFDLKKKMAFEATIVTDSSEDVMTQSKSITGTAPAPALPAELGVLLIQWPASPAVIAAPATEMASAEPPAETLPNTGTALPLMGLLGALTLASSLGLKAVWQRVGA